MSGEPEAASGKFADLRLRVLAAIGLAVVSITALWIGGLPLLIFAALVACVMLLELNSMCQSHGDISTNAGYVFVIGGVLAVLAAYLGFLLVMLMLALTLGVTWLLNECRFDWRSALAMAVIVVASAAIYHLRVTEGFWVVAWIALCVAAADTGGYIFGRMIGGPKLAPRISPKKTWSGFLGGTGLAVFVAIVFALSLGGSIMAYVSLAVLISVVALIGDLMESAAKRYYGVKDSGTIMPGHGGLMDRFDGLSLVLVFFLGVTAFASIRALLGLG